MPHKILFVTGRLAEPALRRTLSALTLPCPYEVVVMPISVAALMTTSWLARQFAFPPGHRRHVELPDDCDLILLPGFCEGDLAEIERACGVPAERGPKDLMDIPLYFGGERRRENYGSYRTEIIAEIQDAPQLDDQALLKRAAYYAGSGADVVDLGIGPSASADAASRPLKVLKEAGYRVSVDSMDPAVIRLADEAGADYILSLNSNNLSLARELRATPVVIPDDDGDVSSLWRNAEQLWSWDVECILDPIAQPIGYGFMRSLHDLYATRRRYPQALLMYGTHHLSEMTDADTTGINALLMGIAEELTLTFVLTTEVAPWARGSVRELDIARRLMHYALAQGVPPKRLEDGLLTIKESRLRYRDRESLEEIQSALTDPNIRIFVDGQRIYAFNAEHFIAGTDIESIFQQLGIDEASHAFYLGQELTKARLALMLGKNYIQDRPLRWGYLNNEDDDDY
ncbi:MAG: DUF6513 domain-containing protein [Chloroflexota bacterium]